jgi:hypothetical protein
MNKLLSNQSGTFFDHIGNGNYAPDRVREAKRRDT